MQVTGLVGATHPFDNRGDADATSHRMPTDVKEDIEHERVEAAWQAFRKAFKGGKSGKKKG